MPQPLSFQATKLTLLALLPPTLFGLFWFGIPALLILITAVAGGLLTHSIMLRLHLCRYFRPYSCLITALLLTLTLRANTPLLIVFLGAASAELLGRAAFKEGQKNLFNPALLGRTIIALFEVFLPWHTSINQTHPSVDFQSGATALFSSEGGILPYDIPSLLLGTVNGSIGETSFLLLFLSALFMLRFVLIKWEGPLSMILLTPIFMMILPVHPTISGHAPWIANPFYYTFASSLLLMAIFFLGDPVTTPNSRKGQILMGFCLAFFAALGKLTLNLTALEMFVLLILNLFRDFIDQKLGTPYNENQAEPPEKFRVLALPHLQGISPSFTRFEDEAFAFLKNLLAQGESGRVESFKILHSHPLGGRGGSHFPLIQKWGALIQNSKPPVLIVNAQEGEPGTGKDRYLLSHYPKTCATGLLSAAHLLRIQEIQIVVEPHFLNQAQRIGTLCTEMLQNFPLMPPVQMIAIAGPGSYIAGEETALLEFLEGREPKPRSKPPLPMHSGLHGRPTLIHNLETLSWIPVLLQNPKTWGDGKLLMSLSGALNHPKIREVQIGSRFEDLLQSEAFLNDQELLGVQIGGASGAYLPLATLLECQVSQESLAQVGAFLGTGSIRFLRKTDCLMEDLLHQATFFQEASCQQCSPCRIGTVELASFFRGLATGKADKTELGRIHPMLETMQTTSLCGLGRLAPHPFLSLIRHFPEELAFHLNGHSIRDCLRRNHGNQRQSRAKNLPSWAQSA